MNDIHITSDGRIAPVGQDISRLGRVGGGGNLTAGAGVILARPGRGNADGGSLTDLGVESAAGRRTRSPRYRGAARELRSSATSYHAVGSGGVDHRHDLGRIFDLNKLRR